MDSFNNDILSIIISQNELKQSIKLLFINKLLYKKLEENIYKNYIELQDDNINLIDQRQQNLTKQDISKFVYPKMYEMNWKDILFQSKILYKYEKYHEIKPVNIKTMTNDGIGQGAERMLLNDDSFWSSIGHNNQNKNELITVTLEPQYFIKYITIDPQYASQQEDCPVQTPRKLHYQFQSQDVLQYSIINKIVIPRSNDKIIVEISKFLENIDKIEVQLDGFTQKQDGDDQFQIALRKFSIQGLDLADVHNNNPILNEIRTKQIKQIKIENSIVDPILKNEYQSNDSDYSDVDSEGEIRNNNITESKSVLFYQLPQFQQKQNKITDTLEYLNLKNGEQAEQLKSEYNLQTINLTDLYCQNFNQNAINCRQKDCEGQSMMKMLGQSQQLKEQITNKIKIKENINQHNLFQAIKYDLLNNDQQKILQDLIVKRIRMVDFNILKQFLEQKDVDIVKIFSESVRTSQQNNYEDEYIIDVWNSI